MAETKSNKLPFILIGVIAIVVVIVLIIVFSGGRSVDDAGLANPAAVYCIEQDGNYTYIGEHAYCVFPDGSECPAWDFFNNTCTPVSGGEEIESVDGVGVELKTYEDDYYPSNTYMYSDLMDVAAGQVWSKATKLKLCVGYKSNVVDELFRSAILYGNSSLWDGYTFQIDVLEYGLDSYCGSWSQYSGGTYHIQVPLNSLASNNDTLHEVCINDLNAELSKCASEWGISDGEAFLTNVYNAWLGSPSVSSDDYLVVDYFRFFVDGVQVVDSVFFNQDFNDFSGVLDDGVPDDFTGWTAYWDAYGVSI